MPFGAQSAAAPSRSARGVEGPTELAMPEWTKGRAGRTRPEVVKSGPEALIAVRRPGQVTDLSEAMPEDPRPVRGVATEETVAAQEAPQATLATRLPRHATSFTFVPRAWLIKAPGAPPARGDDPGTRGGGWLHFPSRDPERDQ